MQKGLGGMRVWARLILFTCLTIGGHFQMANAEQSPFTVGEKLVHVANRPVSTIAREESRSVNLVCDSLLRALRDDTLRAIDYPPNIESTPVEVQQEIYQEIGRSLIARFQRLEKWMEDSSFEVGSDAWKTCLISYADFCFSGWDARRLFFKNLLPEFPPAVQISVPTPTGDALVDEIDPLPATEVVTVYNPRNKLDGKSFKKWTKDIELARKFADIHESLAPKLKKNELNVLKREAAERSLHLAEEEAKTILSRFGFYVITSFKSFDEDSVRIAYELIGADPESETEIQKFQKLKGYADQLIVALDHYVTFFKRFDFQKDNSKIYAQMMKAPVRTALSQFILKNSVEEQTLDGRVFSASSLSILNKILVQYFGIEPLKRTPE